MIKNDHSATLTDLCSRAMILVGACIGVVLIAFQIYTAGFGQFAPLIQRSLHVGMGLSILCLGFTGSYLVGERNQRATLMAVAWFFAALFAAGTSAYIIVNEPRITESFGIIAKPVEMALAGGLILLLLEAARKTTGPALPIFAICALAYTMFGASIPGYWGHAGFSPSYVVEYLFLGTDGLWGMVTGLSANLIAIFIIFGACLLATGAAKSFMDISLLVAGRFPGGAAKVAIFSSALFGMLSGAAVANVATTGNFTIPTMKRLGYRPAFAGAVEATASSAGQLTPPIMGAGAFVMAELLRVPYLTVVYAAIIPAFLFFVCIWISVTVESRREKMQPLPAADMPDVREVLSPVRLAPLVLTIAVTLGLMFSGRTPSFAAFWGIVTNVSLYLVLGLIAGDALVLRLKNLLHGALNAAASVTTILALLLCAQITLSLIGLTGVGIKMSEAIVSVDQSGGLLLGAVLALVVSLVLGMGMPTTAAYLLASAVAVPALIKLGLEPIVAHFFVFYSALLSGLTPPVCTAVFAASVIAKEHWWPICLTSIRLAAMKYILPFFFIFRDGVLLRGDPMEIAFTTGMGVVASFLMAVGIGRFHKAPISLPFAIVLTLSGISVASGWIVADIVALVLLVIVILRGRNQPDDATTPLEKESA